MSKKSSNPLVETLTIYQRSLEDLFELNFSLLQDICDRITSSKGIIITVGQGKSNIPAKKLSASLNSVSLRSLFLDPNTALHGDIGVVSQNDVIIAFSKSGFDPNLEVIFKHLRKLRATTILITQNNNSNLSKYASKVVVLPSTIESDPFQMMPTTSIIQMLTVSDVILNMVISKKKLNPTVLKTNHPAGALANKNFLQVKSILHRKPPIVEGETLFLKVLQQITKGQLGAVVVMKDDVVVGIITDGDVRRSTLRCQSPWELKAHEIMSKDPKSIEENALAIEAYTLMSESKITQLIVYDNQHFSGLVHLHDLTNLGF